MKAVGKKNVNMAVDTTVPVEYYASPVVRLLYIQRPAIPQALGTVEKTK